MAPELPLLAAPMTRARRLVLLVGAAALSCVLSSTDRAWPAEKRMVRFDDLQLLSATPGEKLQLSPSGRRLAVARKDELIVLDVPSGRRVRSLGSGFMPIWSPSGLLLAFYSTRSGDVQLWVWNSDLDQTKQLTQFAGGIDVDPSTRVAGYVADAFRFSWAPDGTRVVFASRLRSAKLEDGPSGHLPPSALATDPEAPLVLTNTTSLDLTLAGVFTHPGYPSGVYESKDGHSLTLRPAQENEDLHSQLFIVDLANRSLMQLTHQSGSYFHPAWSPDGATIAAARIDQEAVGTSADAGDVVLVDATSAERRTVASGPEMKFRPLWSPDGSAVAYCASATTFVAPRIHIVAIVPGREPSSRIVQFIDRAIRDYQWSRDGTAFLVLYKDGTSSRFARVSTQEEEIENITLDEKFPLSATSFSESNDGALAWLQYDPRNLSTIQYLASGAKDPIVLTKFNREAAELALGSVEILRWKNGAGEEMEGTLLLPPQFRAGVRYPLIVDPYPLIGGADWDGPMFSNYAWASMGYVVFRPSPRAPTAWMNAWKTRVSSEAGKGPNGWALTFDDVMSGTDELINRGIVDSDRMCLYGFSLGGSVVDYLVTRTTRFACAVSVAAAGTDWVRPALLNLKFDIAYYAGGTTFENGVSDYIALSPVYHLANVQTPMLLACGDNDDFLLDSVAVYNSLRRQGKQVSLLRYPNQGHGFSGGAMKDFWERETAFFRRYLEKDH